MKANELRVGNLVIANGEIIEVDSINDIGINLRGGDGYGVYPDYEFREIKPVPLTEERLFKYAKIKKVDKLKGIIDNRDCYVYDLSPKIKLSININSKNDNINNDNICIVLYNENGLITSNRIIFNGKIKGKLQLHYFQNLIFALTGEEIILKT